MKQFIFFAFALLIVACCPKKKSCEDFALTDIEWGNVGFDTTNITMLSDASQLPSIFLTHHCIFTDETGNIDTLKQDLSAGGDGAFCEWFCCSYCHKWMAESYIEDTLQDHFLWIYATTMGMIVTFDSTACTLITPFDTLKNIAIQQVTYKQVYHYQIDTANFPINATKLKSLYFVPRKGIVKIELSPTHVWERIN